MRKSLVSLILALAAIIPTAAIAFLLIYSPIKVFINPQDDAQNAVVRAINQAQKSILVQAYGFSSASISEALVRAHERRVKVEMILDERQLTEHNADVELMSTAGIPVLVDHAHAIAHDKILVIDVDTIINGSFDFTERSIETYIEKLMIIHSPELAKLYLESIERHLGHSELPNLAK